MAIAAFACLLLEFGQMRLHYSSIKDDTELILLDLQHKTLIFTETEKRSVFKNTCLYTNTNVLLESPSSEQTPPGIYLCNYLQACTELLLTSD